MSTPPPNLWILWAAHGAAQVGIVIVSFVVPAQPTAEAPQYVLLLGALGAAGVSIAAPLLLPRLVDPTRLLVRMALAEAAGMLGFVAWFLSGERLVLAACVGLGLLALAVAAPVATGRRG